MKQQDPQQESYKPNWDIEDIEDLKDEERMSVNESGLKKKPENNLPVNPKLRVVLDNRCYTKTLIPTRLSEIDSY